MRKILCLSQAASAAGFLVLFLAATGTARAADTLYCGNDNVEIFVQVGSEGVSDVLVGLGDESEYLDPADFAFSCLDWRLEELHLELRKDAGSKHRMRLRAKGKRGTLTLDGKSYPVHCDWER